MVLNWPGVIKPGMVYRNPVSSLDLFPTVSAAAGINLPNKLQLDGVDLMPYLSGSSTTMPHETLFWSSGPNKAVRFGNWKLIIVGEHKFLFDLKNDIGETKNLVKQYPEMVQKLENSLNQWQEQMKPPAWPSKPNRRKVNVDGVLYELNI